MYHEDVDLSLRLRLAGETVGIEPTAVVAHDYEFTASAGNKWRWLERNRLATLVRVYPGSLLLPPGAGAAGDRGGAPARRRPRAAGAGRSCARTPKCSSGCRACSASAARSSRERRISAADFAAALTPDLDSPFIPAVARSLPARLALRTYWRLVRALLR